MSWELNSGLKSNLLRPSIYTELAHLPDEVLMTLLRHGNHNALTVLFERYHRMVLSVALRILRDAGEAEDLTQCVFLEIFRSAEQFDPTRGTVKIWILQSAYNQGFNRRRYLSLRGICTDWTGRELTEKSFVYNGRFFDNVELAQVVQDALRLLSASQREILEFAFYQGFTMREIAEKTGRTFDSVRHDYYRALQKLRNILINTHCSDQNHVRIEY
jgi:RNA polymerase sigma-70 factor (ECF subfamily)